MWWKNLVLNALQGWLRAATWPLLAWLVAAGLWVPMAVRAQDDAGLLALASQARVSMAQRIEKPVAQLPFLCLAERSLAAPLREYVIRQQNEAVQALQEAGSAPGLADTVRRLLRELARDGTSNAAAAFLVAQPPAGAAQLRLAAAIGELPAALDVRMHPSCGTGTYAGMLGRTMKPLGTLARADYQRIAEQQGGDPWVWLALGWLAGADGEGPLQRSLAVASGLTTPDAQRARIFAMQALATLRLQQGRGADAEAAAQQALGLAMEVAQRSGARPAEPAAAQALGDVGQTGNLLAAVLQALGQTAKAKVMLQTVLPIQQGLAQQRPDDLPAQYALIDTMIRLDMVDPAWKIYQALQSRTPFDPLMARSGWLGMLMMAASLAVALTLPLGLILLWRYRARISKLMMMAAAKNNAQTSDAAPHASTAPAGQSTTHAAPGPVAASLRWAVAVQVVAGLAFGMLAAWLELRADGTALNANRLLVMSWTWAWPTVLTLGLLWDGDRRRKRFVWVAYFAVLALMSLRIALGDTPPLQIGDVRVPALLQAIVFWAVTLSYTPVLLLFMNRTLRAIGPGLLAMVLVVVAGAFVTQVIASTPVGLKLVSSLFTALHLPGEWFMSALALLGMLIFAPLAWGVGRWLRAAYVAKWVSDQSLMIDTLWLLQAGMLSISLMQSVGAVGWMGLGAFALHKAITLVGMWPVARAARAREPSRVLLLRVFGHRDAKGRYIVRRAESERLFDLLAARWRYAGPIYMIGAPDLASSTIDPEEFLDFLAGRLHQRFMIDAADLPTRLAALDDRCDFDARWRVTELYCGNDTWRAAVQALMARSALVAMDLRGFGPDNQGCLFELQALIDLVPAERVALLVDKSTSLDFLAASLEAVHAHADAASPNAGRGLAIVQVSLDGGEAAGVDELLRLAGRTG